MHRNRILFRADGDSIIGLGHIYRCLSLMDMLKFNFNCHFVLKNRNQDIINLIKQHAEVLLIDEITDSSHELAHIINNNDIVVLDGYNFNKSYQKFIKSTGCKLVMIDDYAHNEYLADVIINHGGSSVKKLYRKKDYTIIYSGLKYLMLRKEFLNLAKTFRVFKNIDTAFICFGGADPHNNTIKAVDACIKNSFIKKIIVVTGVAYNHVGIEDRISNNKSVTIIHKKNISATELIEALLQCQIAICPASTVSLEACCAKIALLTGMIVENQKYIHEELLELSCAISVYDFNLSTVEEIANKLLLLNDVEEVNNMVNFQFKYINGDSFNNILSVFEKLAS
jgi:UDP-2,4-diacetamido-2,4,6-trideoxy-beta-L-altropyranose hydrolase